MVTVRESLIEARQCVAEQLAEALKNPKPSYNIDGQSVSWTKHYQFLSQQLNELRDQINDEEPFEELSRGC